jgi:hypothetical protein
MEEKNKEEKIANCELVVANSSLPHSPHRLFQNHNQNENENE